MSAVVLVLSTVEAFTPHCTRFARKIAAPLSVRYWARGKALCYTADYGKYTKQSV